MPIAQLDRQSRVLQIEGMPLKHSNNIKRVCAGLLLAYGCAGSVAAEDNASSLVEAVKGGTVNLDFRYRFEGVD